VKQGTVFEMISIDKRSKPRPGDSRKVLRGAVTGIHLAVCRLSPRLLLQEPARSSCARLSNCAAWYRLHSPSQSRAPDSRRCQSQHPAGRSPDRSRVVFIILLKALQPLLQLALLGLLAGEQVWGIGQHLLCFSSAFRWRWQRWSRGLIFVVLRQLAMRSFSALMLLVDNAELIHCLCRSAVVVD